MHPRQRGPFLLKPTYSSLKTNDLGTGSVDELHLIAGARPALSVLRRLPVWRGLGPSGAGRHLTVTGLPHSLHLAIRAWVSAIMQISARRGQPGTERHSACSSSSSSSAPAWLIIISIAAATLAASGMACAACALASSSLALASYSLASALFSRMLFNLCLLSSSLTSSIFSYAQAFSQLITLVCGIPESEEALVRPMIVVVEHAACHLVVETEKLCVYVYVLRKRRLSSAIIPCIANPHCCMQAFSPAKVLPPKLEIRYSH